MSSSGASCFFTLFNLQGARPTSAAGTCSLYHIVSLLSSTFFQTFFGAFQLHKFKSRTLIQPLTALAANFHMISCFASLVKHFFHFVVSRQARPKRCALSLGRSLAESLSILPPHPRLVNTFLQISSFYFSRLSQRWKTVL